MSTTTDSTPQRSPLRWLRWSAALAVVLVVLVLGLPTILSHTSLLQTLLNYKLAAHDIEASLGASQLSWLRPTAFRDVRVADARNGWQFSVAEVGSELSLWQMLMSAGDLGTFVIEQPTVVVSIDEPISLPKSEASEPPGPKRDSPAAQRFRIRINNGTVLVRVKDHAEPLEFAKQINVVADWQVNEAGRVLTIEAGRPLDQVQLTPEMCDTGLKYVAPILGDVAWTQGSLSLDLDLCQIPLDKPAAADVKGRLSLHSVETGLKNPLAIDIATLVARVLKRDLPNSVRLADTSVVEFEVQDAQVSHRGLEFGLPEVAPELVIRTQGTVGFDGRLELLAEIPMPLNLLGDGPIAQALGNQTLKLPIRGSLEEPKLNLEGDGQLASDVISKLLDPVVSGDVKLDDVLDSVRQLRQQRQQRREERGPLFPRLRQRRNQDEQE